MTKFSAPQQNQLAQIGAYLRDNREKQAKSLEDIAIRTYIRPQLLSGIETGNPELLPEPIFVQGFIRRYAEALGINGLELAQQFTVNSIPSTPRPARRPEPEDSATTRMTRGSTNQPPTAPQQTATAATAAPMFSAGNPLTVDNPIPTATSEQTNFSKPDFSAPELSKDKAEALDLDAAFNAKLNDGYGSSEAISTAPSETINNIGNELAQVNPLENATDNGVSTPEFEQSDLNEIDLGSPDEKAADDVFYSKVTEFDQQNLEGSSLNFGPNDPDKIAEGNSNVNGTDFSINGDNVEFSAIQPVIPTPTDEALTTAASTEISRAEFPTATTTYSGASEGPNLKPFIIGGIVAAALTAGMVIFSSLLGGGGERQPSVATEPEATEETTTEETSPSATETEAFLEDPVGTTTAAATPPVSTAPVYVEAKATSEAWVSVLADGNPIPIFEGTLQPGATEVWEAQESISVYSGDAGALELAANGGESKVMGERGQPTETIIPKP
ncbi:MAG: helix-turn-helix domain-containing protein [Cyanobacteria bacterium P01_F01_bin.53]